MKSFIVSFDHTQAVFLAVTCTLIVTDYICGIVKAIKNKKFSSTAMRSGLAKKFTYIVCMFLGWLMEMFTQQINLGFHWTVFEPVCIGIILIEFSSILENLTEINPELKKSRILQSLEIVQQLENSDNPSDDNRKDEENVPDDGRPVKQ